MLCCVKRAIMSPKNVTVNNIIKFLIGKLLSGNEHINRQILLWIKWRYQLSGWSHKLTSISMSYSHCLPFKMGAPIILTSNMIQPQQCYGTIRIVKISIENVVQAPIISGYGKDKYDLFLILHLIPSNTPSKFKWH